MILVPRTEDIKPYSAAGLTVEIMRLFFFVHSFLPCPRLYWLKINTSKEVDHLPNKEYVFRPRILYNFMKLCKFAEHFREKPIRIINTYCVLFDFVL